MMKKKGDLSLNYIFLIFVSLIVVFVIIGLITKWSFNANKYIKNIFREDGKDNTLDRQVINVSDCGDLVDEVVKHAKICYTRARQGEVEGSGLSLCYGIANPGCTVTKGNISDVLSAEGIDFEVEGNPNDALGTNVLVSYDYRRRIAVVR